MKPSAAPTSYLDDGHTLRSWLFTTDHKRIAILYIGAITFFFFVGGFAAFLIRYNLLSPKGLIGSAETYNRLFSMHGILMVWFFLVPAVPVTLGNFLAPLMLGARDLAFPRLNLLSWYLFMVAGVVALYAVVGGGVDTGWTFYTPLTSFYSKGHVIAAVVAIFIAGFSSIATGLNFIVTIHKLRAPGMTWYRMPVFLWSLYATSVILVLATPVLAMTSAAARIRTHLRDRRVRSEDRRRSAAVSASLLVLFASCRLCDDPSRLRRHQRNHSCVLSQGAVRL